MKNNENVDSRIHVPEGEMEFSSSLSSGAGGQNVNKVETRITIHWNVQKSKVLTEKQKEILYSRTNKDGSIEVSSQKSRSQWKNKEDAIKKLNELVNKALKVEKERIPTKVSRSEKERRLEEKKKISQKKKSRGKISF